MSDPVAIITGAGGGIGRATAIELARLGYRPVLVGRTERTLAETRALLTIESLPVRADVTDPVEVERLVGRALDAFGRIDALVNNAGYAPVLSIEQTSVEAWHAVIDTNLSAAFYLSRAAWSSLKQAGALNARPSARSDAAENSGAGGAGGVIVNVSSAAARDPFPGLGAYGAAKAGLNLFALALAREGEPVGIRVHTVAPSATETPMFREIMTPQQYPAEKTLAPADVARVIGQCVRGDLRHTSGEVIYVHKSL
jgi:NAD(P)-dependent dehydrogenase (short-subunit alcohol dehydrogenase family)